VFTKRYPIEPHGPKRLEVKRTRTWSEVIVLLDGVVLGRVDAEGLRNGAEFTLHDHTVLRIWLERGPRNTPMLYLTRNGHPLPGSEGDPVHMLRAALVPIWILALLQIAFGGLVVFCGNPDALSNGIFAAGLILLLLTVLGLGRSEAALVFAYLISFVEMVLLVVGDERKLTFDNASRLILLIFILGWLMMRGVGAIRTLKATTLPIRHVPEPMHRSIDEDG